MHLPSIYQKRLLLMGRIGLTALVAIYVVHRVDWRELARTLAQTRPHVLLGAIGLQGLVILAATLRWRTLLVHQDIHMAWRQIVRLSLTALFFNLFFVGNIGGDTARFAGALRFADGRKGRLALSLIHDRVLGLYALVGLSTMFITLSGSPLRHHPNLRLLALGLPVGCAVLYLLGLGLWLYSLASPSNPFFKTTFLPPTLRSALPFRVLAKTFLLSLATHLFSILVGYIAARSFDIPISLLDAGIVLTMTNLILTLPVTVAGLGIREGVLIWLLPKFGIPSVEMAFALSAALIGTALFWSLIGGLVFHWPRANQMETE